MFKVNYFNVLYKYWPVTNKKKAVYIEYIKTEKKVVRTHTVTMVFVKDWLIRIYYNIIRNV